ncbi:hypothetical protein DCS_04066 [Drechmeria coniospora]|uniref:Uncharacterized protein n=1 Tax=Drechmeria coniospora TaxID=98403 RepID=A0A151GJ07_DRECN|nr:hypothetical protein DCS_04066 [Drechmeria coniospora]KYK57059.1 hypothetical protein DCS_04066 [Drechmeria coniospora]
MHDHATGTQSMAAGEGTAHAGLSNCQGPLAMAHTCSMLSTDRPGTVRDSWAVRHAAASAARRKASQVVGKYGVRSTASKYSTEYSKQVQYLRDDDDDHSLAGSATPATSGRVGARDQRIPSTSPPSPTALTHASRGGQGWHLGKDSVLDE